MKYQKNGKEYNLIQKCENFVVLKSDKSNPFIVTKEDFEKEYREVKEPQYEKGTMGWCWDEGGGKNLTFYREKYRDKHLCKNTMIYWDHFEPLTKANLPEQNRKYFE